MAPGLRPVDETTRIDIADQLAEFQKGEARGEPWGGGGVWGGGCPHSRADVARRRAPYPAWRRDGRGGAATGVEWC